MRASPILGATMRAGTSFSTHSRFCIQQPSGKLRVINDAADGGQSELSHDSNKLDLRTSIQPGLHVQLLLWQAVSSLSDADSLLADGVCRPSQCLPPRANASRSGGPCGIVAYYDHRVQETCFRRYYGSLFGLPNAVRSFHRFHRFFHAVCRRMGYFITSLATQMGSPFQPEKHQAMQSQSDFLGLVHDVSQCYRECILVNLYGFGRVTGF